MKTKGEPVEVIWFVFNDGSRIRVLQTTSEGEVEDTRDHIHAGNYILIAIEGRMPIRKSPQERKRNFYHSGTLPLGVLFSSLKGR